MGWGGGNIHNTKSGSSLCLPTTGVQPATFSGSTDIVSAVDWLDAGLGDLSGIGD